jgi:hypothetical protein
MSDCVEQAVVVCRGWGDYRLAEVPVSALSGLHMTEFAGGSRARLPRATLAAYMSCDAVPEGEEFGHSCLHGRGPHMIKVLVIKKHNDPAVHRYLSGLAAMP